MFFRQILNEDLGCASYVIADGGEAAVIDPKWEIDDYLIAAEEHDFRIAHILETHNHADHVSGRGRLVEGTGATVRVSKEAGVQYEHQPLSDGDVVELGSLRIIALATPGHRPEHMAYAVEDTTRSRAPWVVLTGDSLFVDDVARPDLAVEPEEGARGLFDSMRTLLRLDDFTEVGPGHIGGSLCGGAGMSQKPGSTIGFERRFNRFLQIPDENEFVRELTAELRPQPPNFERIVELNRGPPLTRQVLEPLLPPRLHQLIGEGIVVIDGREPHDFDGAHIPGSLNVTMAHSAVGTRAAWVVDPESELVLVGPTDDDSRRLSRLLEAVGFRRLRGFLAGGLSAWEGASLDLATTPAIDPAGLAERLRREEVTLLDVRDADEWQAGHVEGSVHGPYHELREGRPRELVGTKLPIAVACSVGNRSSLAASLLSRAGVEVVHVVEGGIRDLEREGIALVPGD